MIQMQLDTGRFGWFVRDILNLTNRETEDKSLWEVWLNKVQDETSYEDFVKKAKATVERTKVNGEAVVTGMKESMNLLRSFKPTD